MGVRIVANAAEYDRFISRALAAYFRAAAAGGRAVEQPTARSYRGALNGKEFVVLVSDTNEVIAVYRIRPQGVLKRLRRWPPALAVWPPRRVPVLEPLDF